MATNKLAAPLPTPLPPAPGPAEDIFTEEHWTTLMAIMDTVVPSVRRESGVLVPDERSSLVVSKEKYKDSVDHINAKVVGTSNDEALERFLGEKPSDYPEFLEFIKRTLMFYVPEGGQKGLRFILGSLNTRIGSRLITGYTTPIHEQPIHIREEILRSWRDSYMPTLNVIFKQMTMMARMAWFRTSPTYPGISGFPRSPIDYKPGTHYPYQFLQFEAGSEPDVLETDVVIVGSGCGGAVAASNLAAAGHRVLVVDKGYYFPPSQLPMTELQGGIHLFENGGADMTEDGSSSLATGSTWGGGGTVNWSASLQTQGYVRKEWAQDRGLTFFETPEFQNCLDRVCERMGVSADFIKHNHGNKVILEGARKLGYTAKPVPQNTAGAEHSCGYCTLGCGSCEKQGPIITWLPDAAKAGAKFIEGFRIDRVTFDESGGGKKATGVTGTWTSRDSQNKTDGPLSNRTVRKVTIKAKKVVISCGTMWTPVVLMNSGLTNWQIGRNLYLHPVNLVAGIFKEDVRPWEGPILTSVCTSFENLDGQGHGVKLEATCMLPSFFLTLLNWNSGIDSKTLALKFRHMNGFIAICRNRDTGRVFVDPISGRPRLIYTPSAFDRAHLMEGNVALAKMCYVSGATEIHVAITGVEPYIRNPDDAEEEAAGITSPRFVAWLAELRRVGNKPIQAVFACAHQMGTSRMSVKEEGGVVDPNGRVWGTEGLYVSDASVFPSASGVNPMVTTMAISDWISRGICKDLKGEVPS